MNKYSIKCVIGEGSFGRVYKAENEDRDIVALKLITKCGRTPEELSGLRLECIIQRRLKHPNIIRMLDSFETPNEIIVVTEFAKQDLYKRLEREPYLSEESASLILFDLISALYYLHSNRVLHRDLKPQNVLLCENGVAKLCDFGFARNMSMSTHVLTSIKGTPLYMAPEIIDESPYDHTADLWSLGCIAYEMVFGAPPFNKTSLLNLIKTIRSEPIKWPGITSPEYESLLKGLLNKDPTQRLTWPNLLEHPYVKGKIHIIPDQGVSTPLTAELTSSQVKAKELQKQDIANRNPKHLKPDAQNQYNVTDTEKHMRKLSIQKNDQKVVEEIKQALNSDLNDSPLEPGEWLVFLQASMEEIMEGDTQSVRDPAFLNMICQALSSDSVDVVECIAQLFCLPFTVDSIQEEEIQNLRTVYYNERIIPKMIFASFLLTHRDDAQELTREQIQAVETIYLLITNLVHSDENLLREFCETHSLFCLSSHLSYLVTLKKMQPRIAENVIAILCHVMKEMREFSCLVKDVVKGFESPDIEFQDMLTSNTECLSIRTLVLIKLMITNCPEALKLLCIESLEEDLESLIKCSKQNRVIAAEVLQEIKNSKTKVWVVNT